MATETEAQKWTRRAQNAAISAIEDGANPDDIRAAVEAGIREGQRITAIRAGTYVPEPAPRPATPFVPQPGSAIEALLKATA